jgi:hypothetical protein
VRTRLGLHTLAVEDGGGTNHLSWMDITTLSVLEGGMMYSGMGSMPTRRTTGGALVYPGELGDQTDEMSEGWMHVLMWTMCMVVCVIWFVVFVVPLA